MMQSPTTCGNGDRGAEAQPGQLRHMARIPPAVRGPLETLKEMAKTVMYLQENGRTDLRELEKICDAAVQRFNGRPVESRQRKNEGHFRTAMALTVRRGRFTRSIGN